MTTIHKALEQTLSALENLRSNPSIGHLGWDAISAITEGRKALAEQAPSTAGEQDLRDAQEAPFEAWWESMGQYGRAGGSGYEKTFAWNAWCAALLQSPALPVGELTDEQILDAEKWAAIGATGRDDLTIRTARAVLAAARSQPASEQASVSGCYVVAGAQSRFKNVAVWTPCTVEHHHMVQRNPEEWEGYETRLVYAPQPLAAAPEVKP